MVRDIGKVLYHGTTSEAWETSIKREGLRPNGMGIVYLSPSIEAAGHFGPLVLRVRINGQRLTAFEDCRDWEVLCWGAIPAEDVEIA